MNNLFEKNAYLPILLIIFVLIFLSIPTIAYFQELQHTDNSQTSSFEMIPPTETSETLPIDQKIVLQVLPYEDFKNLKKLISLEPSDLISQHIKKQEKNLNTL
jgi:hypothetical protein